jgi:hypothetical protein
MDAQGFMHQIIHLADKLLRSIRLGNEAADRISARVGFFLPKVITNRTLGQRS